MRRIHKIDYSEIFGQNFKVNKFDDKFTDLELDQ